MTKTMKTNTAPVISCSRLRMATDGQGVTTLVVFHDCPLRCKYCINSYSFDPSTKREEMTPEALYEKVRIDDLYFVVTGGGVTFGGGEPLLRAEFLREFRGLCGDRWHLCAETSLNVPREAVGIAAECIDTFYVDCKDTDPAIYKAYTGKDNTLMLENLALLLSLVGPHRVVVRVPLIPDYNTPAHQEASRERLEKLGVTQFDLFPYKVR